MDVVPFADVDRDHHRGIRQLQRPALCLAHRGPVVRGRFEPGRQVVRQLDEQERKIALGEFPAPLADHVREQSRVLGGAIRVRFALVPDDALDRHIRERCKHRVVDTERCLVVAEFGRRDRLGDRPDVHAPDALEVDGRVTDADPVRLVGDEAALVRTRDDTHDDRIGAGLEDPRRNLVAARRILVGDVADLDTVHPGRVGVDDTAEHEFGRLPRRFGRQLEGSPVPDDAVDIAEPLVRPVARHAYRPPAGVVHVARGPLRRRPEPRIVVVQVLLPGLGDPAIPIDQALQVIPVAVSLRDRKVLRIPFQACLTHPALGGRTAVGAADDADRHVVALVQCPGKKEPHRRQVHDRLRRSGLPGAGIEILPRCHEVVTLFHGEVVDQRIVRARDRVRIALLHAFHGQLHIRLTRRDPHVPEVHVVDGNAIPALDREGMRPACGMRGQRHPPVPVLRDRPAGRLAVHEDGNSLAVAGPAPDDGGGIALQHDAVAQQPRQADVRAGKRGKQQEPQGGTAICFAHLDPHRTIRV